MKIDVWPRLSLLVMAGRQLTDFEQVLLSMVAAAPSTGYDLKQTFATTPLGVYQPSSGALYPALRRLEHAVWVRQPVNAATISQDLPLHVMRFVMMETLLPRDEVLAFLADVRDALTAFLDGLERYTSAAVFADRHSPLALDHGISTFAASLAWTKRTINTLSREPEEPREPEDEAGSQTCLSPGAAPPSRRVRTSRPAGS